MGWTCYKAYWLNIMWRVGQVLWGVSFKCYGALRLSFIGRVGRAAFGSFLPTNLLMLLLACLRISFIFFSVRSN
jgi:hypothetical protein